jgi:hypothetical protein
VYLCDTENLKIQKMPHDILVAGAGNGSNSDIFTAHKEWFEELGDDKLSKEFLTMEILPAYYEELKKLGDLKYDKGYPDSGTDFLIAQGDRLYILKRDFVVYTVPLYDAIGCGSDAAFATHNLKKFSTLREEFTHSLKLASKYDDSVGGPFVFIDTEKQEFEIVESEI